MEETCLDFVLASVIGVTVWLFGGLDTSLKVLIAFAVIDYISGVSAAWVKGIVSSRIGFHGIVKKVIMFSLVGVANLIDKLLPGGSDAVRTVVILAFVSNEGISIMENANRIGVPFPKALQNYLEQFASEKGEKGDKEAEIKHE